MKKTCSNLDKYLHQSEWYKMERKTAPIGRTRDQQDQQTIVAEETYQVGWKNSMINSEVFVYRDNSEIMGPQ